MFQHIKNIILINLSNPESLGVELIDGTQPGSDLRLVKLLNKEFLPQIQNLLLENHIKANFEIHSKH